MPYVLYGIILIALIILVRNIRIVPQAQAYVITRLGAYKTTWGVGLHLKIPFIEAVAKRLSLKEQVADFPPQPVITKDNVTMQIDTVVYYQITDPKLYTYGIEQPILAIENLSATTLRNLIGDLELDQCLTSRDIVNTKMRQILDEATDPWGIKVNRVELKNILPPKEIQSAMEKQMKAERERREAILRAEGEKRSAILTAEGEKESAILRADAKKQEQILEAQGRAEAILTVQRATAEGIRLINSRYHELKIQIADIRAERDRAKQDAALARMESGIRQYEAENKTGNPVLDTLLTAKSMDCQQRGINMTSVADGSQLGFLSTRELCTLVGAPLDNAIESVLAESDPEKRLLRVAIYNQSGCVMLRFENYCAQPVEMGADGLPVHNAHGGYDLQGVQATAQRHDGTMTLHWADGWFTLRILLPVPS